MAFLQTPLRLWSRDLVKRGISDSVIMQIVDIYSIKVFKGIKIHFQHLEMSSQRGGNGLI